MEAFTGRDNEPAAKEESPSRSSSTAWRKLTPSVFITQSITEPPSPQAPRQFHRPLLGVTTSDGSLSS